MPITPNTQIFWFILIIPLPIFPGSPQALALSALPGVSYWKLDESFHPRRASTSLTAPLASLTPSILISGRQWLYEATDSSQAFSLSSGLLRWNKHCIYESNPSNLKSRSCFFSKSGTQPPGWWHRQRNIEFRSEPLILLSTHNNPNYFHWLTQPGLAPLFLQSYFNLTRDQHPIIALSHRPRHLLPRFVEPLLSFIAPQALRLNSLAIGSSTACLFALQEHDTDVFVSPAQLRWLRSLCKSQFQSVYRPWRRIYLSRNNANTRRCLNEEQLISALVPYGFQSYCLESLPVEEQLRLFSESSVVVGPHGAGFTNMIACAPSAAIIELLPRPGNFSHYYAMADQLELQHGHLLGTDFDANSNNFIIDPDQLVSLLYLMELI